MQDQLVYQSEFQFYFLPEKKLYCVFYKWLVEKKWIVPNKIELPGPGFKQASSSRLLFLPDSARG